MTDSRASHNHVVSVARTGLMPAARSDGRVERYKRTQHITPSTKAVAVIATAQNVR